MRHYTRLFASVLTVAMVLPLTVSALAIGDRVQTSNNLNVRSSASAQAAIVGTAPLGAQGTIVSGPTINSYTWWNIRWDNGLVGWSVQDYLQRVASAAKAAASFSTTEASGLAISATPNPCTLDNGATQCASTISWSAPSTQIVQVWVQAGASYPVQFACTAGSGSLNAPWISGGGDTFILYPASSCDPSLYNSLSAAAIVQVSAIGNQPASPYSNIRSTTWYEFGPSYADSLANLRAAIPSLHAAGFNTVWLVTPWMDMQSSALPSATWNESNFTALKQTLDVLRANNMQALMDLNYLGQGWSPAGIDACTWTQNSSMYSAFTNYVSGFLQRINGYQSTVMIMVATEAAEPCSMLGSGYAPQVASIMRNTIGNLPMQIPSSVRSGWRIGYHDYDELNLGWLSSGDSPIASPNPFDFLSMVAYEMESYSDSQIASELSTRAARFRALYPSWPLIVGEYGAVACDSSAEANQSRVVASILNWAIAHNAGGNLWQWQPVTKNGTASDCSAGLSGAGLNLMNANGTPRPAADTVAGILGGSIVTVSIPPPPSNFTASCDESGTASLGWSPVSGADSYRPIIYVPIGQLCPGGWTDGGTSQTNQNRECHISDYHGTGAQAFSLPTGATYTGYAYSHNAAGDSNPAAGPINFMCAAPTPITLTASPNPCTLLSSGTCSSTISWTAPAGQTVQVWINDGSSNKLMSCSEGSSSTVVPWIGATPGTFSIYKTTSCDASAASGKTAEATLVVKGVAPPTSPDGTSITPISGGTITASNYSWSFSKQTGSLGYLILKNGVSDGSSGNLLLVALKGKLFVRNNAAQWFKWTTGGWQQLSYSLDKASLLPSETGSYLLNKQGIWYFGAASTADKPIYRNGKPAGAGMANYLINIGGTTYARNSLKAWYSWNGTGWVATAAPTIGVTTTSAQTAALLDAIQAILLQLQQWVGGR